MWVKGSRKAAIDLSITLQDENEEEKRRGGGGKLRQRTARGVRAKIDLKNKNGNMEFI